MAAIPAVPHPEHVVEQVHLVYLLDVGTLGILSKYSQYIFIKSQLAIIRTATTSCTCSSAASSYESFQLSLCMSLSSSSPVSACPHHDFLTSIHLNVAPARQRYCVTGSLVWGPGSAVTQEPAPRVYIATAQLTPGPQPEGTGYRQDARAGHRRTFRNPTEPAWQQRRRGAE